MTISEHSDINIAHDYYEMLSILSTASSIEIKQAYHQALLRAHPDKIHGERSPTIDIGLLKQAFITLSSPELRARYDALRSQKTSGPRPAQVISLEEFTPLRHSDDGADQPVQEWLYSCRCGGTYKIDEEQMNDEQHLIGCNGCSEVVWVGFESADEDDEEQS